MWSLFLRNISWPVADTLIMENPEIKPAGGAQLLLFDLERMRTRAPSVAKPVVEAVVDGLAPRVTALVDTAQGFMRQFDRLAADALAIYEGPAGELNPLDPDNVQAFVTSARLGNPRSVDVLVAHLGNRAVHSALRSDADAGMRVYLRHADAALEAQRPSSDMVRNFESMYLSYVNGTSSACDALLLRGAETMVRLSTDYEWVTGILEEEAVCQLLRDS